MSSVVRLGLAVLLLVTNTSWAKNVDLDYQVRFLPEQDIAQVSIVLEQGEQVRSLTFDLGDQARYSDFKADGVWLQDEPGKGVWQPAKGKASLQYNVKVSHQRDNGRFDARMTPDWVVMRGDDLIPSAHLDQLDGTRLNARLQFELPEGWKSIETGWPRIGENRFRINNPARLFDRPVGWLTAGKIGSRRTLIGDTMLTVAAPIGEGMRRMDITTFLTFVWPQMQQVFPRSLDKLLIVGADDPMWRGGLSASNSLFLHSDRPLVSENGTSSLLHELVHVVSRIRDTDRSDWISEGIAEFYAIELLRRAGGMTEERYNTILAKLEKWSKNVSSLRTEYSSGAVTARAVLLLRDLDNELREVTKGEQSLDDVVQALMRLERVSTQDFIDVVENVLGRSSKVLDTRLLR